MALKHTNPTKPRWDAKNRVEASAVAPYNFVPLPDKMVVAQPPLDHDSYQPEPVAYSGRIECELKTCSPTYIRGMLTEKQLTDFEKIGSDKLTPEQKNELAKFFGVEQDVPLIPGSSLRGMIRQLVEIVGHSRMRYVSPTPTFTYRAVAAQNDDPLREPYRAVVGAFARNIRAGYLEKRGDEWWIQPAPLPQSLNLSEKGAFLKVKERDIPAKAIPGLFRFNSPDYRPQYHLVSFNVETRRSRQGPYSAITHIGSRQDGYGYEGTLVCSGNMMESGQSGQTSPRKNHALILAKNNKAQNVKIDPQAIQDYRDGLTPFQEEALTDWGGNGWGVLKDGAPVFYVQEGNMVRYFGHSPNFRIPARLNLPGETRAANPSDFVPEELRSNPQPDLAEAIFGWVEDRHKGKVVGPEKQRSGRVSFGDAHCIVGQKKIWFKPEPITLHVLSGPKATTFQHYLVQDGHSPGQTNHHPDQKVTLSHYGTPPNETQIRGYKMYWHKGNQPDIQANAAELKHPKQLTFVKPVQPGVRFRFNVYFENLRPEELGLLWWCLALPGEPGKTYRHKLGMGKPLGMGSISIEPSLFLTKRTNRSQTERDNQAGIVGRYENLFSNQGWYEAEQVVDDVQPYIAALNHYLLQDRGLGVRHTSLLELERIQALLTMLEWHEGTPEWLAKTRYMEIEHGPKKVNEYKERPVLPSPSGVVGQVVALEKPAPPQNLVQKTPTPQKSEPSRPEKQPQLPPKPTTPQPGNVVRAKIAYIDKTGKIDLEILDFPGEWIGYISAQQLGGKKYREEQVISCEVVALHPKHGETSVECRPAGDTFQTGEVVKFDEERGYGFIQPDTPNSPQLFVHKNRLAPGLSLLRAGERVQFKVSKAGKRLEAQDVRREE